MMTSEALRGCEVFFRRTRGSPQPIAHRETGSCLHQPMHLHARRRDKEDRIEKSHIASQSSRGRSHRRSDRNSRSLQTADVLRAHMDRKVPQRGPKRVQEATRMKYIPEEPDMTRCTMSPIPALSKLPLLISPVSSSRLSSVPERPCLSMILHPT